MAKCLVVLIFAFLALTVSAKGGVTKSKHERIADKLKQKRFDWNHGTVAQIAPVMVPFGGGDIKAPRTQQGSTKPGGHNYATRRAMDYVIGHATTNPALKAAVEKVYGFSLGDLAKDNGHVFAMYSLLYGNFQNELRVNLDGDKLSDGTLVAAGAIGARFGADSEITGKFAGVVPHSKWWNPETGYTSANPIHSMLAESKDPVKNRNTYTQAASLATLKTFVLDCLTQAIDLLEKEQAKAAAAKPSGFMAGVSNFFSNAWSVTTSYLNGESGYPSGYAKALRLIGSVLHAVQDSAVACTPLTKTKVPECKPGDGHGILEKDSTGTWRVIALGDGQYYDKRHDMHAKLDSLYAPGNVADMMKLIGKTTNAQINALGGLFESFDPAIAGGRILMDVATAVVAKQAPATAAQRIAASHVFSRYKEPLTNPPPLA